MRLLKPGFFLGALVFAAGASAPAEVDFRRDILPLLSQNCFECHGPDARARKADLRLDNREDALRGGENGSVLSPVSPEKNLLLQRIQSTDPDHQMPPPDSGKTLSDHDKTLLATWITEGAPYATHWALLPPDRPAPGKVSSRSLSPIDSWIEEALAKKTLSLSPPAQRARLLRRLHLDLRGLPPSLEDQRAFLQDSRPEAVERVVDKLLASPAFGEKWARMWLDLARYADSNGFQRDGFRTLWPFRDWVIAAFNADLPYDQFVIHQLAGDMLENPSLPQKVATGFHRCTTLNLEAGTNRENERRKQVIDRVNVTGTVFLGLTLECAQCHSHKYDPISQEEYYRIFAYFNNTPIESKFRKKGDTAAIDFTEEPAAAVPLSEAATRQLQELRKQLAVLREKKKKSKKAGGEPDKKIKELQWHIDRLQPQALVMREMPQPRQTRVFLRGDFESPGPAVTRHPGSLAGRRENAGQPAEGKMGTREKWGQAISTLNFGILVIHVFAACQDI